MKTKRRIALVMAFVLLAALAPAAFAASSGTTWTSPISGTTWKKQQIIRMPLVN